MFPVILKSLIRLSNKWQHLNTGYIKSDQNFKKINKLSISHKNNENVFDYNILCTGFLNHK